MSAYYNEIDAKAAVWLGNLCDAGHVMPGRVDSRSIADVRPDDFAGVRRAHFFAGIGGWDLALQLAGWPEGREVWTGSCPCQPFSAAGKGRGTDDERHLWPEFFRLIDARRPATVFGEQVASPAGLAWFDGVSADLERAGYTVRAADICAAGVGAPHIRQRLWWRADRLADADDARSQGRGERGNGADQRAAGAPGLAGGVADTCGQGDGGRGVFGPGQGAGAGDGAARERSARLCADGGLADADGGLADADGGHAGADGGHAGAEELQRGGQHRQQPQDGGAGGLADALSAGRPEGRPVAGGGSPAGRGDAARPGPADGFWRDADWLFCRDGKWRPVEPGTFPLADGISARMVRLRAYGNAIVPQVAAAFIRATEEGGLR